MFIMFYLKSIIILKSCRELAAYLCISRTVQYLKPSDFDNVGVTPTKKNSKPCQTCKMEPFVKILKGC